MVDIALRCAVAGATVARESGRVCLASYKVPYVVVAGGARMRVYIDDMISLLRYNLMSMAKQVKNLTPTFMRNVALSIAHQRDSLCALRLIDIGCHRGQCLSGLMCVDNPDMLRDIFKCRRLMTAIRRDYNKHVMEAFKYRRMSCVAALLNVGGKTYAQTAAIREKILVDLVVNGETTLAFTLGEQTAALAECVEVACYINDVGLLRDIMTTIKERPHVFNANKFCRKIRDMMARDFPLEHVSSFLLSQKWVNLPRDIVRYMERE